jgi:acetolactate synthase-1/2/3 large subunit
MRAADYVFEYLKAQGVNHAFMLSGGGIMYLVDALGRSEMEYICCHHEQAAAIAAQAYGMYDDALGVCLVTTGPGGTNALTGAAAAYMDSTPVLYLSGQVKRSDFASLRGVRQYGAQENDIVSMAKPVTKYAVTVMQPEDVPYELEKCVYIATHGRKGPVWLDIPLDIQSAEIDPAALRRYCPEEAPERNLRGDAENVLALLKAAKRPLLLAGHGTVSSRAQDAVRSFAEKTGIPVMSTWRALELMGAEEDGFFGAPGLQAPRYSNLILQSCDLLLVLGSRLDNMITAYNEERFARLAHVVAVDLDENELKKLRMPRFTAVLANVGDFVRELNAVLEASPGLPDWSAWVSRCREVKRRYPLLEEKQAVPGGVDLYKAVNAVSHLAKAEDTLVISSTSRCNTAGHIAFDRKRGQKSISSMGFGSMGFALPSAVGAYYAGGKHRVLVFEGDGSFQLNIQELETIVSNGVDARMFIFNNSGYAAITTMQDRNFGGYYVGSNEQSGLWMPDLERIAAAYGFPYRRAERNEEIPGAVRWALEEVSGPCIVDIRGTLSFDEIPKCISSVDESTGQRVSAALENPFPFLSGEELENVLAYLTKEEETNGAI